MFTVCKKLCFTVFFNNNITINITIIFDTECIEQNDE